MAKIIRYPGNLVAFASSAIGAERTVFGDTAQDNTLAANINEDWARGWGIVGVNDHPTKQDFNGATYAASQLTAYLHQVGVPEWDSLQEYHIGSFTNRSSILYVSKINDNIGTDPATDDGSAWALSAYQQIDTANALRALSLPEGSWVRTAAYASYPEALATGGAIYDIVSDTVFSALTGIGSADDVGDLILANGNIAMLRRDQPGGITPAMFDGDADAAATTAALANVPLSLRPGDVAKVVLDPTSGDDIQALAYWLRSCSVPSTAQLYLELANGNHTVNTNIILSGDGPLLDIRATAAPDESAITAVSFELVSGTKYRATITIPTALPAQAVVGSPIGIQQPQGDNSASDIAGAQIIQSIAVDRLSFKFDFNHPTGAPVNPTAMDNTLQFSLPANKVLTPKSSLICQSTGWDGAAIEGFLNLHDGAKCSFRNFGMAYSGTAGTEHDLILARGIGAKFYAYDKMILAGAGDKVLRQYGASEMYLNRSCVGGAGLGQELWQGAAGSAIQLVRTSCGGATNGGFAVGAGCNLNFAQGVIASTPSGVQCTAGGDAAVFPAIISGHTRGLYAVHGRIAITSETYIRRNTTGIDWLAGGEVAGPATMGTGSLANTTNSSTAGNVFKEGGIWYDNIAINPGFTQNEGIVLHGTLPCKLLGTSGNIYLQTNSGSKHVYVENGDLLPLADNAQQLGSASLRYSQVFAAIGTINTSDARDKTDVRALTKAERAAARDLLTHVGLYKFKASIEDKGDAARSHVGATVQGAIEIMRSHGLDPFAYGFICYDKWDGDDKWDGGDRYGFRYDQLILFIIAGTIA